MRKELPIDELTCTASMKPCQLQDSKGGFPWFGNYCSSLLSL